MPETYTRRNFNPSVIPAEFRPETRKTIELAVAVGWKFLVTDRGHCTIIAPNDTKRFHMNAKNAESGPVQSVRRQVLTHGDPKLVAALEDSETTERDRRMAKVREEEAAAMAKAEAEGARKRAEMGLSATQPPKQADPQPAPSEADSTPSEALLGTRLYTCGECDRTFTSPRALSGHANSHTGGFSKAVATKARKKAQRERGLFRDLPEDEPGTIEIANGRKVTHEDGTVTFECGRCDRTFGKYLPMQSHQKKHNGTSRGFPKKDQLSVVNDTVTTDADSILEQIRDLVGGGPTQGDYDALLLKHHSLEQDHAALVKDHQALRDNLAAFKDLLP